MHPYKLLTFISFNLLMTSCGYTSKVKDSNFSIHINSETNVISNENTLTVNILNLKNLKIDSIQLSLDNKKITKIVDLTELPLGEKLIKVKVSSLFQNSIT